MAKNRDEFSEKTKHIIASRVAYCCSKPDCQVPTCGPCADTTSYYNIGVASHITAASEGFARYDKALTSEQRKHAENGIWMCQTHGKEIDDDEVQYPVDLLKTWKKEAEERARGALGKVPESSGLSLPFVALSRAERYGLDGQALLPGGSQIPFASIFDLDDGDLTYYASISYVLRFLIAKTPAVSQITLYQLVATVYDCKPMPKFGRLAYALPQRVYPHFVVLKAPEGGKPRPCYAENYCGPTDDKLVPFTPLTISEDNPEVIDVRFTAENSGIYEFALDAVVMHNMRKHTFRVFDTSKILFERYVFED